MAETERSMAARLLASLDALAAAAREGRPGLTVAELARTLGRDKSIVSRQLRTLVELGLVERDDDGRHRLGWRLFTLAAGAGDQRLLLLAPAVLRHVAQLLHERVHLSVLHGNEVLTIRAESSRRAIESIGWVGRTSPIHCSSSGRALLFDHTDAEVRELLKDVRLPGPGPNAPKDADDFLGRLEEARGRGYAVVDGEHEPDLVAAAAPVRDFGGRIIAAINVSGPAYRLRGRLDAAGRQVAGAARHLHQILVEPPEGP